VSTWCVLSQVQLCEVMLETGNRCWNAVPSILEFVQSEVVCISDWQPLHFEEVEEDERTV